ncbi:hypothetical protein MMC22_001674 [Lobaria immixta]|nr:hypothetical protein [Lobaria immixta]
MPFPEMANMTRGNQGTNNNPLHIGRFLGGPRPDFLPSRPRPCGMTGVRGGNCPPSIISGGGGGPGGVSVRGPTGSKSGSEDGSGLPEHAETRPIPAHTLQGKTSPVPELKRGPSASDASKRVRWGRSSTSRRRLSLFRSVLGLRSAWVRAEKSGT